MNKWKNRHSFEMDTMIVFIFFQLGNVLNYCFQFIIGRMLTVEDYGMLNALQSWVNIVTVPCTVIILVTTKYVSEKLGENKPELINKYFFIQDILLLILIVMYLLVLILSLLWVNLFHVEEAGLVILIGIAIVTTIVAPYRGLLQGSQDFIGFGTQNFIFYCLRFILCIGVALFGCRYNGIMVGYGIATILTLLYCRIRTKKTRTAWRANATKDTNITILELLRFFLYAIVIRMCMSVLINGDMLVVNALFSAKEKGLYSSTMVISKIPLYVSAALVTTILPKAATLKKSFQSTKKIFVKSIVYGLGIVIMCIGVLIIFDDFIIGVLLGEKYLEALNILPVACFLVIPVSILNIIVNYALAIDRIKVCTISIIVSIFLSAGYALLFHQTINQLLLGVSIILTLIMILNIFYFLCVENRNK